MSGSLEQRYRRLLRVLPGYYREQCGPDMVAALGSPLGPWSFWVLLNLAPVLAR